MPSQSRRHRRQGRPLDGADIFVLVVLVVFLILTAAAYAVRSGLVPAPEPARPCSSDVACFVHSAPPAVHPTFVAYSRA